ncbi:hypothetical protein [Methylobacterium frigidaeris]|uniref:Uncharacterized protein n=1 Tax=Methylobacterium frigidaeris TaxID=2038277 RepID=A0AA37HG05_9HYPH|nr:hypothetical protein [Methylobacterium frigidaeris]PIK70161.1 hypothetical protein CS379_26150 [Methylobacterium frigidaeris]GJD65195.1 hypothetical protein MPEAHAMD_5382 [Methylobacterium frigidaeris]
MTHQTQQMQQPQPQLHSDARLATLETRVGSIESMLSAIAQKLDARSAINWAPISILATVLIAVGGMGFAWINGGQSRLEALILKVEARASDFVPRADLDTRFQVSAQRRDDAQRVTDGRLDRIERDADALTKQVVPRDTHLLMWEGEKRENAAIRERLNAETDRINARLDRLEAPRLTRP